MNCSFTWHTNQIQLVYHSLSKYCHLWKKSIFENKGYFIELNLSSRPIYFIILYKHSLLLHFLMHSNSQWIIHKSIKDKLIAKRDQVTSIRSIIFTGAILRIYVLMKTLVWLAFPLRQYFQIAWQLLKIKATYHMISLSYILESEANQHSRETELLLNCWNIF